MVMVVTCSIGTSCSNSDSKSQGGYQEQYSEELAKKEEQLKMEEKRIEEERQKMEEERLEEEKRLAEEKRQKEINGPDWLQGTWSSPMYDDRGNYLGTMKVVIDHGHCDTYANDRLVLSVPYIYSSENEYIHFVDSQGQLHGGMPVNVRERKLLGNTGDVFRKIQ